MAVAVAVGFQRERFSVVVEATGWQGNCVRWISCEMGVGVSGDAKWQKYGCRVEQVLKSTGKITLSQVRLV